MIHGVPVFPTAFPNRFILGYPDYKIQMAIHVPTDRVFFELLCHGSPPDVYGNTYAVPWMDVARSRDEPLDAQQLFDIIVSRHEYDIGQPVRLLMCWVGYGPNSLAQQLSDLLGTVVLAANERIEAKTFLPCENGVWLTFKPRYWR
ncbi:MAG: hypothetical protein ACUVSW_03945 [Roseiflexus sp.]